MTRATERPFAMVLNGRVVNFDPAPEHGCYYERGRYDEIGGLMVPMLVDGSPDLDSGARDIEVQYADA